jgi:hypothetical protein
MRLSGEIDTGLGDDIGVDRFDGARRIAFGFVRKTTRARAAAPLIRFVEHAFDGCLSGSASSERNDAPTIRRYDPHLGRGVTVRSPPDQAVIRSEAALVGRVDRTSRKCLFGSGRVSDVRARPLAARMDAAVHAAAPPGVLLNHNADGRSYDAAASRLTVGNSRVRSWDPELARSTRWPIMRDREHP